MTKKIKCRYCPKQYSHRESYQKHCRTMAEREKEEGMTKVHHAYPQFSLFGNKHGKKYESQRSFVKINDKLRCRRTKPPPKLTRK